MGFCRRKSCLKTVASFIDLHHIYIIYLYINILIIFSGRPESWDFNSSCSEIPEDCFFSEFEPSKEESDYFAA